MPGIIINDRGYDEGDFSTPERNIPEGGRFEKMTEACQSVGLQSWGYNKDEDRFSPRYLMYSIDRIMARGGSYLLNVGPRPDGIIDESSRRALARIGKWYRSLEETMEDTEVCDIALKVLPSALPPSGEYLLFKKNGKVYIHFPSGLITDSFYLSECPYLLKRVRLMNNNTYLDIKQVCPISLINKVTGIADRAMTRISGIPWELLDSEPIALELTW